MCLIYQVSPERPQVQCQVFLGANPQAIQAQATCGIILESERIYTRRASLVSRFFSMVQSNHIIDYTQLNWSGIRIETAKASNWA